jgi:hypothetical protein
MSGGQTYFVRVNHTMNAVPEARTREQAEKISLVCANRSTCCPAPPA